LFFALGLRMEREFEEILKEEEDGIVEIQKYR
jgi:hypothetical protein